MEVEPENKEQLRALSLAHSKSVYRFLCLRPMVPAAFLGLLYWTESARMPSWVPALLGPALGLLLVVTIWGYRKRKSAFGMAEADGLVALLIQRELNQAMKRSAGLRWLVPILAVVLFRNASISEAKWAWIGLCVLWLFLSELESRQAKQRNIVLHTLAPPTEL